MASEGLSWAFLHGCSVVDPRLLQRLLGVNPARLEAEYKEIGRAHV